MPELVIVANRLPVEYAAEEGWRRAPGGLVSAMQSVLRDTPATWVGWSGGFSDAGEDGELSTPPVPADAIEGVELVEVPLTRAEVAAHYDGFSNGALWPNYHGGIVAPVYHRSQFETHREVNRRFADLVAERARPGARVWVHDYQLQLVPALLRASRPDLRIGFFLHIPFPPVEIFSQLPWRDADPRGTAGRGRGGLPDQRRRGQLPAGGASLRRRRPTVRASCTSQGRAGRVRSQFAPTPSASGRATTPTCRGGPRCRNARGRSAPTSATPTSCSWAWTGWTTPRASTSGSRP